MYLQILNKNEIKTIVQSEDQFTLLLIYYHIMYYYNILE